MATMNREFSPLARFLLWEYTRGSMAYDVLCAILIVVLLFVPSGWWGDPMLPRP